MTVFQPACITEERLPLPSAFSARENPAKHASLLVNVVEEPLPSPLPKCAPKITPSDTALTPRVLDDKRQCLVDCAMNLAPTRGLQHLSLWLQSRHPCPHSQHTARDLLPPLTAHQNSINVQARRRQLWAATLLHM